MTSTDGNNSGSQDMVLKAYFEYGAQLPVEIGTLEYENLREIAREVSTSLVKPGADSETKVRREVAALALVSSAVEHFPVLVSQHGLADNPEVDTVLVELIDAGVTEVDTFLESPDPTKFDESDDPVVMMLEELRGVADKARQYNEEVLRGVDGIEPVVTTLDEFSEDEDTEDVISIEDLPQEGPLVEESEDGDEIDGSTF